MATKRGNRWVASGYDPATKRKRHLGTHATKREAEKDEAQWKLRSRSTSSETCDQFAGRWTTDYPRPRESSNITNRDRVAAFARDFKDVRLGDLDKPTARKWARAHLSQYPAVRTMFGDAVRDGLIESNPFSDLRLPGSRGRKDLIALTEPELRALADVALDPRMELHEYAPQYRAMILFAGYVGLRPGELYALGREDVHGQMLTIDKGLSARTNLVGPTKNGKSRTVIIPPVAEDALLDVPNHPSGLLFVSPAGKRWNQPLHHRYWRTLRLLANRPDLELYELRHCAATMLLERGVTPWDVAAQLGHQDGGQLVMRLYGHPSEAGARARLLAAWDSVSGPTPISGVNREANIA